MFHHSFVRRQVAFHHCVCDGYKVLIEMWEWPTSNLRGGRLVLEDWHYVCPWRFNEVQRLPLEVQLEVASEISCAVRSSRPKVDRFRFVKRSQLRLRLLAWRKDCLLSRACISFICACWSSNFSSWRGVHGVNNFARSHTLCSAVG